VFLCDFIGDWISGMLHYRHGSYRFLSSTGRQLLLDCMFLPVLASCGDSGGSGGPSFDGSNGRGDRTHTHPLA